MDDYFELYNTSLLSLKPSWSGCEHAPRKIVLTAVSEVLCEIADDNIISSGNY